MLWSRSRTGRFLRRRGGVSIQSHFGSFLLLFPGFMGVLDRCFDDPLEQPIASRRVDEKPLHQIAKPAPSQNSGLAQLPDIRRWRADRVQSDSGQSLFLCFHATSLQWSAFLSNQHGAIGALGRRRADSCVRLSLRRRIKSSNAVPNRPV
jgi:hypothetical protein